MDYVDLIGWAAAAVTLIAYFQRTMLPLRAVAMVANALFLAYGLLIDATPTLALNASLMVFNGFRLWELWRLTARVRAAREGTTDPLAWLAPLLSREKLTGGTILFRRGDNADKLYYLRSGLIALEEIGITLEPGSLFGELAFFSDDRRRSQTARCLDDCEVLTLDEGDFLRLYYQNPDFGLYLVRLVARRLVESERRAPGLTPRPPAASLAPPESP